MRPAASGGTHLVAAPWLLAQNNEGAVQRARYVTLESIGQTSKVLSRSW